MEAVTGREVVLGLMELGTEIAHWNKKYSTKEILRKKLDEMGMTSHQLEVMGFMYNNPELTTVSQLATELFISKGSLSLMLSKLEVAGFVQKKSAKGIEDGRKVYVTLTERGNFAVEQMRQAMLDNASAAFDEMDTQIRMMFHNKIKELKELFYIGGWKE